MANVNVVVVAGNLTRDPEMKYTSSGNVIASMGLAVNSRFRDRQTNEMREDTTFIDLDLFGRQAEIAGQYLAKGRPVLVEGRLKYSQWEDKNSGQRRSKLSVVGTRIQLLGSKPGGDGAAGTAMARSQSAHEKDQERVGQFAGVGAGDVPEDSIPF